MKVHFENNLIYIEYQPVIDYLVESIERTIPDSIDNINLYSHLEFCNQYDYEVTTNKDERSLLPWIDLIIHITMMGYVDKKPVSRNLHKHFLFTTTNLFVNGANKMIDLKVIKLLLLAVKFAKKGELDINEEIGESDDFF